MMNPRLVPVILLIGLHAALAHEAPVSTNLIANGDFGDKLAGCVR